MTGELDDDNENHQIPGWDRPAWAVRGVKDGAELIRQREASVDVTYTDGGVEDTFAPELIRTDQVVLAEDGAAVHVGAVVIHFADGATSRRARRGSSPRRLSSWQPSQTAGDENGSGGSEDCVGRSAAARASDHATSYVGVVAFDVVAIFAAGRAVEVVLATSMVGVTR
jgi:hypothetical protein